MRLVFVIILAASAITSFSQNDNMVALEESRSGIKRAMEMNDFKTARRHAERAVDISSKVFKPEDRDLALAYENLAIVLATDGKHKLAVEPLRQALRIFQTDPIKNGPDISNAMQKLGDALALSGDRKEAEKLFSGAVEAARQLSGERSKETLKARAAMACFYLASDKGRAYSDFGEVYALTVKYFGSSGRELDDIALICDGSFLMQFWENERFPNIARKQLNGLVGYEIGKPKSVKNADYAIRLSDIGSVDRQATSTVVKVWVDQNGNPTNAKMVFGPSRFSDLSTSAARATKFTPSIQNGTPISDVFYVSYFFIR